jgi:hypothetical protein
MPNNANTVNIETFELSEPFHTSLSDYTTVSVNPSDVISITGSGSNVLGAVGSGYTWNTTSVGANGTGALDWGNLTINTGSTSSISQAGVMELHGKNADIKVNGRSLMDAIDALEQRLNILVPNPELEAEWDELRELGERYRELEKKCKEKGEMWKKLKQMPPPEVK